MGQEIQCCTSNIFKEPKDDKKLIMDAKSKDNKQEISPLNSPLPYETALDDYCESMLSNAVKTVTMYNNKYVLNNNHSPRESIPHITIMINDLPSPTLGNGGLYDFEKDSRPKKQENPFSIKKMMGIPKDNHKIKQGENRGNTNDSTTTIIQKNELPKITLFNKISVPRQDEDAYNDVLQQHLDKLIQEMSSASLLYPVKDDLVSVWKNRAHCIEWKDSYLDQIIQTQQEYDSNNEDGNDTIEDTEEEEEEEDESGDDGDSVTSADYGEIESSINNSEGMMSILAFQGIGCHYTRLLRHNEDSYNIDNDDIDNKSSSDGGDFLSDDDVSIIEHGSNDDEKTSTTEKEMFLHELEQKLTPTRSSSEAYNVYISDFTFLQKYQVREGFMKYGAAAYFNDKCEITSIYVSHFNELYYPPKQNNSQNRYKAKFGICGGGNNGDDSNKKLEQEIKQWEIAKEVWKMSLFVTICIRDNICWNHLMESNVLLTNLREILPSSHCIRRLLKIFTFRTGFINYSIATAMLPKGALIHRIFAFKYDSLKQFIIDSIDKYHYKSFLKRYDENLANNFNDSIFGFDRDCKDYYKVIKTMITLYTNKYYDEDFEKMRNDNYLMMFWKELLKSLKVKSIEKHTQKFNDWIDLITTMICNLTAVHNQVGHGLTAYMMQKPQLIQPRITINNPLKYKIQPYSMFMIVNILSTITKSPSIKGQFDHLLLLKKDKKDNSRNDNQKLKKIFDLFRKDLKELQRNIEHRNKNRRMNVNYMNPRFIRCSQSI